MADVTVRGAHGSYKGVQFAAPVSRFTTFAASWLLLVLIGSLQYQLERLQHGQSPDVPAGMRGAVLFFAAWLPLVWPLRAISRRYAGGARGVVLPRLAALAALAAVAQIGVRRVLSLATDWEAFRSLGELAASHLFINVVVAIGVIGVSQAMALSRLTTTRETGIDAREAAVLGTVGPDRTDATVARLESRLSQPPDFVAQLPARDAKGTVLVAVADVCSLTAADNYVEVETAGRTLLVRTSLSTLASRLDPAVFVRIHRSAIVNIRCIRRVIPASHGELVVELTTGRTLKVSRSYAAAVKRQLVELPKPEPRR
jgi:DNA-binding LytR/AlgR family response regulator